MAAGSGDKEDKISQALEPASKGKKKNSKTAASFFTPLSKKTKVAKVEAEAGNNVDVSEEQKDDEFQEPPATIEAPSGKKKQSKKKAKVVQDVSRDVENASAMVDSQTEGSQPDSASEHKQEGALSPCKTQSRASPAKKKRKAQQNVVESKPSVGVHGPDLFLQARLAAEENARLSAGRATHPFFARPKAGGARSLGTEEAAHSVSSLSLNPAPGRPEKALRMSPSKPPHPFFARQHTASAKAVAVDESPSNNECDSLAPCLPLHITQNMPEEEVANIAGFPYSTWRCMPAKSNDGKVEGSWSFASYQPSYIWTWPSSSKKKSRGQPISRAAAFGRVIEYLTSKPAGSRYLLSEEVESVAHDTQKLVDKFSSYYYPSAQKDSPEQPSVQRRVKPNNSINPLWTDQYHPQTSLEVCGNNECVKTLSSWLQKWIERVLQKKCALKIKGEAESSSSDDDSDFEDSPSEIVDTDGSRLDNCLLVTGPVGCGKSAAIYACAMEHGFSIIEVNASECRSGALIKHKFKEAMESHGLGKRRSSTTVDASDGQLDVEQMLKQDEGCRRSIFPNEEPDNQQPLSQSANRSNLPSSALRGLRVILFEDVDIVFEEDSGFMGALALLARTSKCPIIFTSNSQKPVLPQAIELEVLRFEQPSTAELVAHAYMVCMAEEVSCSPHMVENIVKTSGHDLRKLLMLLQFWTQESPADGICLEDACAVENPKMSHSNKQNSNLVNCLLQLDGCPQVPATRIHAAGEKLCNDELNPVEPEREQNPRNALAQSTIGICHNLGSSENCKRSLDSDWLYAHDCQHRVLPILMPSSEPCQLTVTIASYLEDTSKAVIALADQAVAHWSRQRFVMLKAKEEADFQARKVMRKLQAAARKELNGRPSEGFSFMKLIQSSYDSPAALTASNECMKDSLAILQEPERSSSEERESDLMSLEDSRDHHMSGVETNGFTCENVECTNPIPVPDMNLRSSSDTGRTTDDHDCIPGSRPDVSVPDRVDLGGNFSLRSRDSSVAATEAGCQYAAGGSAHLGLEDFTVHAPQREPHSSPIPINSLATNLDMGTQFNATEQSCNQDAGLEHTLLFSASSRIEQIWSEMRKLQLRRPMSPDLGANILLEGVLQDLSACDYLSSRSKSASKASMESKIEHDDYVESSSWNNCIESAAVLAQLRLNQAVDNFLPPTGLHCDTWQVGPSVSRQDAIRDEKQALEDERVDLLLPQRCRVSGRSARLDYLLFRSQLTPAIDSEVRIGRATRQRKLI